MSDLCDLLTTYVLCTTVDYRTVQWTNHHFAHYSILKYIHTSFLLSFSVFCLVICFKWSILHFLPMILFYLNCFVKNYYWLFKFEWIMILCVILLTISNSMLKEFSILLNVPAYYVLWYSNLIFRWTFINY